MTELVLNVGDKVRNIRNGSARRGWIGTVLSVESDFYVVQWMDKLTNYPIQEYYKDKAHLNLEKIEEPKVKYGLDHIHFSPLNFAELEVLSILNIMEQAKNKLQSSDGEPEITARIVLSRVRRNVLTGWTQDELVAQYGHAVGVRDFNTRALGKTTGQVLACIADAINNPGKPVAINGIDHARARPGNSTSWTTLNKHFLATIEATIDKLGLKGFTVEPKKGIMTFNPIVVEETYAEVHSAR